jgi:hypothetical protein
MTGMVSPTKVFNQDKSKSVWNPSRYLSWEGGAWNDIKDWRNDYNKYKSNIDELNKALADGNFTSRIGSLAAHIYEENKKNEAI